MFGTAAAPVVRTTREFGFSNPTMGKVLAITFSGRRTPTGPVETFAMNAPRRGFMRKDGTVSITNASGNWGKTPTDAGLSYVRVWDFKPETMKTDKHGLFVWAHTA